jgi:mevalonate kinase
MSFSCPSKLTGAGGGGCALTLLQHSNDDNNSNNDSNSNSDSNSSSNSNGNSNIKLELTKKLESLEFAVFSSTIGGDGVRWHDMYSV